ncbi:MAG: anti-sigma factor [Chloroflexi bacterium]|nr:anti-sigma factor [Chloroflexota bacterium]
MTNAHIDDLIEEYALGLLEADEVTRADAHLAHCARCRVKVDSASNAAAVLALMVDPASPAAETGQRLLARAASSKRRLMPGALLAAPRFNPWPLIAIANLALTVVVAVWALSLQAQLRRLEADNANVVQRLAREEKRIALVSSPEVEVIKLAGTENSPESGGQAYLDRTTNTAWITVYHLPEVGEGETYQAWLIGPEGPVSAGTFKPTVDGRGEIWVTATTDLAEYKAVGVSREPEGGSRKPTKVVVVGGS